MNRFVTNKLALDGTKLDTVEMSTVLEDDLIHHGMVHAIPSLCGGLWTI